MLTIAFYHRRLVIIGVVLGILGGAAAALLTSTQYTADALLMVLIGRESAGPQDVVGIGPGSVNIDGLKVLQSEISIIESVDVIERAVAKIGPALLFPEVAAPRLLGLLPARPVEQQKARAAELLRRRLFASDSQNSSSNGLFNGSNIMRVTLTMPDRELSVKALAAVIAAYLEQRRSLYATPGSSFLVAELDKTNGQIKQLDDLIQALRTRFNVLDIGQDVGLAGTRLDGLVQRQNGLRERQEAVRSSIATATEKLREQPERVFQSRELSNQTNNDETRNTLLKLQLDRAHLAAQYAPGYPALVELDQKIAAVQGAMRADAGRQQNYVQRDIRNPAADLLNTQLVSLQVEASALETQLAEIDRQTAATQARVTELREADQRYHELQRQRDTLENVQRQISLREANVRVQDTVTAARNANVNQVQPPAAPFTGTYMGTSYAVAAVFAGLMLGLSAALVASRLRQVYVVPREAERDLQLVELGDFAFSDQGLQTAAAQRELANLASLMIDEALASPRRASRGVTVMQLTGLDSLATAALAHALSVEFAQRNGMRTLLINADLEGTPGAVAEPPAGRAGWGVGQGGARMAAVPSDVPGLYVADNAAPVMLRGERGAFVPALQERCDIVLVYSVGGARNHAVRRIAAMADTTIFLVVAEQTRASAIGDLRDAVLGAGGRAAGFVFTGRRAYIPRVLQQWV